MLSSRLSLAVSLFALASACDSDDAAPKAGNRGENRNFVGGGGSITGTPRGDGGAIDAGGIDAGDGNIAPAPLMSCAEFDPFAPGCRANEDCANTERCAYPLDVVFVSCTGATRECEVGTCPVGEVCVERVATCSCGGAPSTECQPDCRTVASCPRGQRCDGMTGICIADCFGGATACSPNAACNPGSANADENGCVKQTCLRDADCPCGVCLANLCYDRLGQCEPATP